MNKELINSFKEITGNVLTIGVNSQELLKNLEKKNINLYSLNKSGCSKHNSQKNLINKDGKKINIKKLRKYFYKKSLDYIICNFQEIKNYTKYFVKDSICINSNTLIIYTTNLNLDIDYLVKQYKRYTADVLVKKEKEYVIIKVNNKNTKNKKIKEKMYYVQDSFHNFSNFVSDILVS
jgi:hypothetical protein